MVFSTNIVSPDHVPISAYCSWWCVETWRGICARYMHTDQAQRHVDFSSPMDVISTHSLLTQSITSSRHLISHHIFVWNIKFQKKYNPIAVLLVLQSNLCREYMKSYLKYNCW